MICVVLDTNVFISGIFWERNYCSQIIELWKSGRISLITSRRLVEELVEIMQDFKIKLPAVIVHEWRNIIFDNSHTVVPTEEIDIVKEDSDDNILFETAISGNAQYIVTQDKAVLKINNFRGIKVLKPEDFLRLFS